MTKKKKRIPIRNIGTTDIFCHMQGCDIACDIIVGICRFFFTLDTLDNCNKTYISHHLQTADSILILIFFNRNLTKLSIKHY